MRDVQGLDRSQRVMEWLAGAALGAWAWSALVRWNCRRAAMRLLGTMARGTEGDVEKNGFRRK